uniref:Uncharacterized protein n=1 Tax=virus sp. ctQ5V6 TaxID=2825815 RepID=A0A8S5RQU6_9VIRU|nr:MAG TPA: hypothetical protein [virus sp. ctQ5V6]
MGIFWSFKKDMPGRVVYFGHGKKKKTAGKAALCL